MQKYLFNCFLVFLSHHLLKISSCKVLGLLFIFVHISTGHSHFLNNEIHDSCEPDRPTLVFFGCKAAVNTARNACFKVCGESLYPVLTQKRNPPREKAYLCISVIQALFSLYFLCMGCFHQLMIYSRGGGKTNKYTNIHAYIHTHTFRKTISRNQVRAHTQP